MDIVSLAILVYLAIGCAYGLFWFALKPKRSWESYASLAIWIVFWPLFVLLQLLLSLTLISLTPRPKH